MQARVIVKTGDVFGKWTVLSISKSKNRGGKRWLCRCECGTKRSVDQYSLIAGKSTCCGGICGSNFKDLTGLRFGRWIVKSIFNAKLYKIHIAWNVLCDCGNTGIRSGNSLVSMKSQSCGCLVTDTNRKLNSIPNNQGAFRKLFGIYSYGAKAKNRSFNLNEELFSVLIFDNCFYCSSSPRNTISTPAGSITYSGIDRVDSDTGYVKYNCVSCCENCNYAKNDMTIYEWCSYVELFKPGFTQETMKKLKKAGIRISKSS